VSPAATVTLLCTEKPLWRHDSNRAMRSPLSTPSSRSSAITWWQNSCAAQRFSFTPPRSRFEEVRVPLSAAGGFAVSAATGGPIHLVAEITGWYD
jgi:hypothetical protein